MSRRKFFCPYWGSEGLLFDTFLTKVKEAGYDGVEMSLPRNVQQQNGMVKAIREKGLELIAQHWETVDKDFNTHLANYKSRPQNLTAARPLFINSQTGKNYYSFEQNAALIKTAEEIANETGVKIIHETHRGKFSFAAHVTKTYLDALPHLQLCLDISHWCCAAETLLEDQQEAVDKTVQHTHHIHARAGYAQGPQVMDPRAPEWKAAVETHIDWWRKVVEKNDKASGTTTITTEFGPHPYLQHLPYTQQPSITSGR